MLTTKDGCSDDAIKKLFMRVDANSDEAIDWDEFVTYMLLENQGNPQMNASNQVEGLKFVPSRIISHPFDALGLKEVITTICRLPPGSGNRYATASRDGTMSLWNSKVVLSIDSLCLTLACLNLSMIISPKRTTVSAVCCW